MERVGGVEEGGGKTVPRRCFPLSLYGPITGRPAPQLSTTRSISLYDQLNFNMVFVLRGQSLHIIENNN